jgi:hypothetical protein
MLKPKQPAPAPNLAKRIADIHAEVESLILQRASEIKKSFEGTFSLEYIVFDLKKRAWDCPCKQYLALKDEG